MVTASRVIELLTPQLEERRIERIKTVMRLGMPACTTCASASAPPKGLHTCSMHDVKRKDGSSRGMGPPERDACTSASAECVGGVGVKAGWRCRPHARPCAGETLPLFVRVP